MSTEAFEMTLDKDDYFPELAEALDQYASMKEKEGAQSKPLTADQLTSEQKATMGLDLFPEDIQDDILKLSQKIIDYVVELATQSEEEAPVGAQRDPSFLTKLWHCYTHTPYRDIGIGTLKAGGLAVLKPQTLPTVIATKTFGGLIWHMGKCMTTYKPATYKPPVYGPMRPAYRPPGR